MRPARNLLSVALVVVMATALAPSAFAQAIDIPLLATSAQGPATWVNAGYSHQFKTNVRDSPAKFERESVQGVAGHRFQVSDEVFLIGNAAYNGTYYNFTKGTGPTNQLRWNDIHQGTLAFGVGWKILLLRPRHRDPDPDLDRLRRFPIRSGSFDRADRGSACGAGAGLHDAYLVHAGVVRGVDVTPLVSL